MIGFPTLTFVGRFLLTALSLMMNKNAVKNVAMVINPFEDLVVLSSVLRNIGWRKILFSINFGMCSKVC